MPEHVESVNRIAAFFREQAETANPQWKDKFANFATALEAAKDELVRLYGLTSALPPDLGNVHDLPPELLEELSIAKSDELEDQLVTVINAYGGEATLDQILVGLYRKFKVSQKRRFIQNKLYRMSMVWSVDGKKGVYTTSEPDEFDDLLKDDIESKGFRIDTGNVEDEVPF
ncbi:hypothetical protein SAMN05216196_1013 [Lutimaribacter pacificus]|uniref:Uncharacterized protein n=1 Tax=Lutimaribacter pacificus TaxID=391948 RepID=A0A1H0A3E1_9RHOB|nr:hypothetical protein [Lutimaribacter pacificus]SDN27513.1 hypothetical protein SAMN05216196_1013 [Lutimaribacter pacificus]SHJ74141.1 hypothetical protein SAMN05444142_1011214 [Lutimaribacter pacificus]